MSKSVTAIVAVVGLVSFATVAIVFDKWWISLFGLLCMFCEGGGEEEKDETKI